MKHEWIWSIAGYDPSGASGILADKEIFNQKEIHGCGVITFVSAQNLTQIEMIYESSIDAILNQIQCLQKTCPPEIIKIGALGSRKIIEAVTSALQSIKAKIIYDPVLSSHASYTFSDTSCYDFIRHHLLPLCDLFTPNRIEAEALLGISINDHADRLSAAKQFIAFGCQAVYLKGGHTTGDACHDLYMDKTCYFYLSSKKTTLHNIRGTGCRLSALFAANCLFYQSHIPQ